MAGEINEMIEIYTSQGIAEPDACTVLRVLAKYPDFFVDHMLVHELGLMPPRRGESPFRDALTTLLAFIIFGCAPLLPYMASVSAAATGLHDARFLRAVLLAAGGLFLLGWMKARRPPRAHGTPARAARRALTGRSARQSKHIQNAWLAHGLRVAGSGTLAGLVALWIGASLQA